LERDPNYARAYAGLGQSYWRKYGQTQARTWVPLAKAACVRAVELDNNLAMAHSCLGVVSNGTGQYQQAAEEFRHAATLDPSSDDALLGLAAAYQSLGRSEEAESYLKRAIQLQPQYWGGYTRLGNFYFAAARYREAEEQYRRVVMLVPEGEFGYSNLGAAYLAEGRYAEAVTQFERSLQLESNATAYSNLASAYLFEHKFQEAAHTYESAVHQKDAVYWQWGNLAEAYAQLPAESQRVQPTYRKANDLVGEVLHVDPHDVEAIHYASLYNAMMGNRDAALGLLRKIPADSPRDPELWCVAAKIHYHFGMNDQALAEISRAVSAGYAKPWIRDDPAFTGLASNLQFQHIVQ
jgi:serine/threonine-protein kinase